MKTIPAQLLSHEAEPVTTLCFLVKVECVGAFAGTILAFANLDVDVPYNDGAGLLTYQSGNGFTPMRIASTSNISVDDSEIRGVIGGLVTEAMIRAGIFNSAKVTCYRVNYEDLTSGRHEVVEYGRAGRTIYSKLGFNTEFRSLSELLKQPISQPYSLTCIAQFGSMTGRWACKKAIVWAANGTVDSIGVENDRIFGDSGRTEPDGYFSDIGGVVEWLTGNNAGIQMEIDNYTGTSNGGTFDLSIGLPYPIQIGDTYRPRRDCDHLFPTCRDVYGNNLNFRGQNKIPNDNTAQVPGAEIVKVH